MRSLTHSHHAKTKTEDRPAVLARLLFRAEVWLRARLLPLQIRGRSLREMLELAEPPLGGSRREGVSAAFVVRTVRRVTRHPWVMRDRRCLREGLLAYRLLAETGLRPRLHFGVERGAVTSPRVAAHCWVTLDGRTMIGESDVPYVEILVHPAAEALRG